MRLGIKFQEDKLCGEGDIQIRELYAYGERGDYLEYSRNTYKNKLGLSCAKLKLS